MIDLDTLQGRALSLIPDKIEPLDTLQARVRQAYRHKVFSELLNILQEDPLELSKVEAFLQQNWLRIKGTSFCYTAMPDAPETLLLCDVAKFCAEKGASSSAIQLLMPGIVTNPALEPSCNLIRLSTAPNLDSPDGIADIFDLTPRHDGLFLHDNKMYYADIGKGTCIQLSDDQKVKLDSLFTDDITMDGDAVVAYPDQRKLITAVVGSETSVLYPDLSSPDALPNILSTHVLDDQALSLLPIRLLSEESSRHSAQQQISNPYYDFEKEGMSPVISPYERERMESHCTLTRELIDAKANYELQLNDTSNLLGHLRHLCTLLTFNSAAYGGGVGKETDAGAGTYAAIFAFSEYYKHLAVESIESIPSSVRAEIDKLLSLASDSTININATENLETCITTRRKKLEAAMYGQESALSAIGIAQADRSTQLLEAKADFNTAKAALNKALNTSTLDGHDSFGLTATLLKDLGINFSIESERDLETLGSLSPEEIRSFMGDDTTKEQFVNKIKSIENLVTFSLEISPARLEALFQTIAPVLASRMIKSPEDFTSLLMILDTPRYQIIFKALKDYLPDIIKNARDLYRAMTNLSSEQIADVCAALGSNLQGIIKSSDAFFTVMQRLGPEQRTAVYAALKEHLPGMIHDAREFQLVMVSLNAEQTTAVCIALKEHLSTIIEDSYDFSRVMQYLGPEQRTAVYAALKEHLPGMIHNVGEFQRVMISLNAEQISAVCIALKDNLSIIIKNSINFTDIMSPLNAEQQKIMYEAIKYRLPDIINNSSDFANVMGVLSPEQRTDACIALKDQLSKVVKNEGDFVKVMQNLSLEQGTIVCTVLKEQLSTIITSPRTFGEIINQLQAEQTTAVCIGLKDHLSTIIKKSFDFTDIMRPLNAEQRNIMYEAIKDRLPYIINNVGDFTNAMGALSPEQRTDVCIALAEHYPRIIQRPLDFIFMNLCLDDASSSIFRKITIPLIMKKAEDVTYFSTHISGSQRSDPIFELTAQLVNIAEHKELEPSIDKVLADFFVKLISLKPKECVAACTALRALLPDIIKSPVASTALRALLPDIMKSPVAYTVLRAIPPDIYRSPVEFGDALKSLNRKQRTAVFLTFRTALPLIIKSPNDLQDIYALLLPVERSDPIFQLTAELIEISEHRLPEPPQDTVLDDYLDEARKRIAKVDVTNAKEMLALMHEFKAMLDSVSHDAPVSERIAGLQDNSPLKVKIYSCPLQERKDLIDEENIGLETFRELRSKLREMKPSDEDPNAAPPIPSG